MWDKIALILLIIGGVNWGLVGIFEFDLVAWLFGGRRQRPQQNYLHSRGDFCGVVHIASFPKERRARIRYLKPITHESAETLSDAV